MPISEIILEGYANATMCTCKHEKGTATLLSTGEIKLYCPCGLLGFSTKAAAERLGWIVIEEKSEENRHAS